MQGFADFADGVLGGTLLLALAVALGGVAFALVVVPPLAGAATDRLRARTARLLALAAGLLAVLQMVALGAKAAVLAADLGAVALERFPGTLQFRAGAARAASAALLCAAAWLAARRPRTPAAWAAVALASAATVLAGAWLVHAAGRVDERAVLMVATVLHQVAASLWAGGLVHLVGVWRLARRDAAIAALWPSVLVRFSYLASGAIALLVVLALPLTWRMVGSWGGLVGTAYGSLVVTKVALLGAALVLAAANHLAVRAYRRAGARGALASRVPVLLEAEIVLAGVLLFTAASLSSQPPARDLAEHATVAEVAEVFRPKLPTLRTPSLDAMQRSAADPYAAAFAERTYASYSWSNFSHNVAGVALLAMSVVALGTSLGWRWAANWPAGLVLLGVFVFLRSLAVDGIWPFGPRGFWGSTLASAEDLQHRLAGVLATTLGVIEWRARRSPVPTRLAYVFPVLATAGGLLLLVHAHVAFEPKSGYLVQVTHSTMGALAVLLACGRLLELRLGPPLARLAGVGSTLAMLLIALVLVFYREANVVVPDDAAPHAAPRPAAVARGSVPERGALPPP